MVNDLIESDDNLFLLDTKLDLPGMKMPSLEEHLNYNKTLNIYKNNIAEPQEP